MWLPDDQESDQELGQNPYESFMKKHLQHYGYFTGRNQNYRNGFQQYNEWEKTYTYEDACSSSSDSESDSDDTKSNDNKLQDELRRTTQLIYSCESGRMVPKLREPRNLYALAKELGPQQAARWPSEIQVEKGRVHHLYYVPAEPEPFYTKKGTENTPMCQGEENEGKIVFEYDPKLPFFIRSRVGGSRNGCSKCSIDLKSDKDITLLFESRFESGNLAKAVQVGDYEYELWLRYDLYTSKHTQWFYFRINNMKPNISYRFTIVNFLKPDSLYNFGMRPCMYSDKEAQQKKVGWIRAGQNIKYYRNNLRFETSRGEKSFYSLTWTMQFPHENDTVYLAHCYPYTYSDLQDYLLELQNDPIKSRICKQRVLCRTLAGNLVYVLTITSATQNPDDLKHKKAVIVTSRVHPGESNASWMMKGFLDYLTGNSADAKLLRDTFIFKVVPMLNPDGVIVGNYRCSLAGRDLNRNYKTVLKDSYPSVWHTKNMIRRLLQERDVIVYCDLHGHSRRQNVFIYGCEQRLNTAKRLHERIFPCMLSKNVPDKFSYNSCKFKVQKSKEGTGRIVMWNLGVMNSYTMEATFCGSTMGKKKGLHFTVADYESLGYHFCDTLLDYCDPDNSKYVSILGNLENQLKMKILARFGRETANPADINLSDYASDVESSDGGSDSSVSDGPPLHLQFNLDRRRLRRASHAHHFPHCATRSGRTPCACFSDMPLKKKKLKTRKDLDQVRQVQSEEPRKSNTSVQSEDKSSRGAREGTSNRLDKVTLQPLHFGPNSGKWTRTQDDRNNNGIPIFVQERCEERQQKKQQDYLDALTAAYLQNGIPVTKDSRVVHFRYSEPAGYCHNLPFNLESLCAHHGQTLAAQLTGQENRYMPSFFPTSQTKSLHSEQQLHLQQQVRDRKREDKKLEHLCKMAPKWLQECTGVHITPFSNAPPGNSAFKIWKLLSRRQAETMEQTPVTDGQPLSTNTGGGIGQSQFMSHHISSLDLKPLSHPHYQEAASQEQQQNLQQQNSSVFKVKTSTTEDQDTDSGGHRETKNCTGQTETGTQVSKDEKLESDILPISPPELGQNFALHTSQARNTHASKEVEVVKEDHIQWTLNHPSKSVRSSYIRQRIKEASNDIKDMTTEIEDKIKQKLQEVQILQQGKEILTSQKLKACPQHMHVLETVPIASHSQATSVHGSLLPKDGYTTMSRMTEFHQQQTSQGSVMIDLPIFSEKFHSDSFTTQVKEISQSTTDVGAVAHQACEEWKMQEDDYSFDSPEDYDITTADETGEMVIRTKSAQSSRQVVEAMPAKISLMISSDHKSKDDGFSKKQFHPLYRSVRAPFFRNCTQTHKK